MKLPRGCLLSHSRAQLKVSGIELGGGSITALPFIETQAGDVQPIRYKSYQSLTASDSLFNAGVRPAIDAGLQSRVGDSDCWNLAD